MSELKKSLKEAVKRLAYNTSVDHLKKQGVKRVNVLGLDRIVSLIEEAVHRSLRHKLVTSEREAVVDATKEEFLKLLKSNEELKARHEAAEEESNNLRIQLDRLQAELTERLNEAEVQRQHAYEGEDEEIARRVAQLFERRGAQLPEEMRGEVFDLIHDVVVEERRETLKAREAAKDREVDNLQRRIKKLTETLSATESRLTAVSSQRDFETGIASIYREVQGLQGSDQATERKKELMADIFAANLKLQKKG